MNLSKKKLALHEKNALLYDLSHPILPRKVNKEQIKVNLEKLIYNLKRHFDAQINDEIKDELKFMVKKLTEDASSICSKWVNQSLHNTFSFFAWLFFAWLISGMGNIRPVGRIRPARPFYAARRHLQK